MGLRVPLTDIKRRKTRLISSHRTMRRNVHRLLGQKMDLRYPRACQVLGFRLVCASIIA